MNVPRGTNFKAALVAARLLENEDLKFYSIMDTGEDSLEIYGGGEASITYGNARGRIEIWWSVEIEARSWGIKDIVPHIDRLKLEGWFEGDRDDRNLEQYSFSYEYPEPTPHKVEIGPDPDAPTPDNVLRLGTPKWTIKTTTQRDRGSRTTFIPEAEVDLDKHLIEIRF